MRPGFRHGFSWSRARFPRKSLQRRLFVWFGVTILFTGLAVALVFWLFGPGLHHFDSQRRGLEELVAGEFRQVWSDQEARHDLAVSLHEALGLKIQVEDASGQVLDKVGGDCQGPEHAAVVRQGGLELGTVRACVSVPRQVGMRFFVGLIAACSVLWLASALIARRLTRPFGELVRVTREIGGGKLSARVRLGRHGPGEVGVLAEAINEMAARIEKQLKSERELLAAVSHELRSPLARLRVLAELARAPATHDQALVDLEQEIADIDALVGKLLAGSRLDFEALTPKVLSARDQAVRALESLGLSASLLHDASQGQSVEADPTLLGRALQNLLENAQSHGEGVKALRVSASDASGAQVLFEVDDAGPGFREEDLRHAFEPFFQNPERRHGSLGIGLSLVQRIAEAHGGRAYAMNLPGGGARVGFGLPGPG